MLYAFHVDEEWTLVESNNGAVVYSYGSAAMTVLQPGQRARHRSQQMPGMNIKRTAIFDDSSDSSLIIHRTAVALALVLNRKLSGKRQGENTDGKKSNVV